MNFKTLPFFINKMLSSQFLQHFSQDDYTIVNSVNNWLFIEYDTLNCCEKIRMTFFASKEEALHFFETEFVNGNNIKGNVYDETNEYAQAHPDLFYFDKDKNAHSTGYPSLYPVVQYVNSSSHTQIGDIIVLLTDRYYQEGKRVQFYSSSHRFSDRQFYLFSELKSHALDSFRVNV